MKFVLLASTALIINIAPLKAQSISVMGTVKEAKVKNDENKLYIGEKIIVKQNQTTKGDLRPVSVQDNIVEITGGPTIIKDKIFGAENIKLQVQNNSVSINGGNYGGDIVGGQSYNQSSQNNKVTISSANLLGTVFGGISYYLNASENSVEINNGSTLAKRALGGQSHEKDALKNTVKINNSTLREAIYGGYSYQGNADNNSVHIKNSIANNKIYGGFSRDKNAINNKLIIEETNSTDIIYGGASTNGDVTENSLIIENGSIFGEVYGGYSDFGNVTNNTLTIKNGKFNRNIYDGYSQQGKVTNNRIIIEGGEFVRTFQIISNYITISNAPSFNSNIVLFGRCGPSDPIDVDCLIKFVNYSGSPIAGIANSKKVEIDKDSKLTLLRSGTSKIGGDLDLSGTLTLRNSGENSEKALIVNNFKANNAKIIMSNIDFISITGIAEGNAEVSLYFPFEDSKAIMNSYRIFDGETSKFDYTLKNEYILNLNSWHSYKLAKNKKNKNYVDVVSKRTIYADGSSLAIPIEIKKDTVDKIELLNKSSINTINGTANLIVTKEMKVDNSSITMDYNDYFVINDAFEIKDSSLAINVSSAKTGKYKIFMDKDGKTLNSDGLKEIVFTEPNTSFNYTFKEGVLDITNK